MTRILCITLAVVFACALQARGADKPQHWNCACDNCTCGATCGCNAACGQECDCSKAGIRCAGFVIETEWEKANRLRTVQAEPCGRDGCPATVRLLSAPAPTPYAAMPVGSGPTVVYAHPVVAAVRFTHPVRTFVYNHRHPVRGLIVRHRCR